MGRSVGGGRKGGRRGVNRKEWGGERNGEVSRRGWEGGKEGSQ